MESACQVLPMPHVRRETTSPAGVPVKRPARPDWEGRLWFWVTDSQYDHLMDNDFTSMSRRENFEWWVREALIERPVKRALCLVFGHYPVPDYPRHPNDWYCIKCNKSLTS